MIKLIKIEKTVCPQCSLLDIMLQAGDIQVDEVKNIDEEPELIEQYNIQGAPTLIFTKDGQEVDRIVGTRNLTPELIQEKLTSL